MTQDKHTPYRENIPAYAIGALDADEIAVLEAHLKTCASCQIELAEFRALSEALLMAVPPVSPPAALRQRVQRRLPHVHKSPRPRQIFSLNSALGLAVILLFVLNLLSFIQLQEAQRRQDKLLKHLEDTQLALMFLSSPGVRRLPLDSEKVAGALLLDEQRNQAILIARDLPPLAENQAYQIWLIEPDEERISLGLFRPEEGETYTLQILSPSQPFENYLGIGVTIEPAGGSERPSGERIIKVDF